MIWSPNGIEKSLPHHDMIFVEGGRFMMGSDEDDAYDDEQPVHEVQIEGFYMAKYPVTQSFWLIVMGNTPSRFKEGTHPVEQVSWGDTQVFIGKLSKITGKKYRLPTEAEWEYSAKGGRNSEGYKYSGSNKLNEVGWFEDNSFELTKPVGLKYPNELGLFDMSGNVWEWCQDLWHRNHEEAHKMSKRENSMGDENRVRRGGSWLHSHRNCRSSCRHDDHPDIRHSSIGFRLASSL